jgi:hypothetical protein
LKNQGTSKTVGKSDADSTPAMAAGVANRLWEISWLCWVRALPCDKWIYNLHVAAWRGLGRRPAAGCLVRRSATGLVIDDWAMSSLSEPERRDFWEICEDRYQVRSTI